MGLEFDPDEVEKALLKFAEEAEKSISTLCQTGALEMESYAKLNRPWTDRTGHARQRLTGRVEHPDTENWTLVLSHGVEYGIYLESAHEKKYAIIQPTIKVKSAEILSSFQSLIDNLSGKLL